MSLAVFLEMGSYAVTVFGLPYAVWVFWVEQRKERENEEEEAYQQLSDAYNDFLKVVLDHADLQLRSQHAMHNPTPDQKERMLTIFGFASRGLALPSFAATAILWSPSLPDTMDIT